MLLGINPAGTQNVYSGGGSTFNLLGRSQGGFQDKDKRDSIFTAHREGFTNQSLPKMPQNLGMQGQGIFSHIPQNIVNTNQQSIFNANSQNTYSTNPQNTANSNYFNNGSPNNIMFGQKRL